MDVKLNNNPYEFANLRECIRKTRKIDGIRGFYKGLPIQGFYSYSMFGYLSNFDKLANNMPLSELIAYIKLCVPALLYQGFHYPFDLISRRQMMQSCRETKDFKWAYTAMKAIYRQKGITGKFWLYF